MPSKKSTPAAAAAILAATATVAAAEQQQQQHRFPRAFERVPKFDASAPPRPSIVNCTWQTIDQPLSHFDSNSPKAIPQRVCVYDKYWSGTTAQEAGYKTKTKATKGPVFFYTGNESPVDLYVNNTGIMWELGKIKNALLVFSEHRFFGKSYPTQPVTECYGGISPHEALKDHSIVIEQIREQYSLSEDHPVFAFGGSYGGMLTAWLKNTYPKSIVGGLAASAPLGAFAEFGNANGTARAQSFITKPWTPKYADKGKYCADNMRAYFILQEIARQQMSDALPNYGFDLFTMAEGSYGFPSTYIGGIFAGEEWPAFPVTVMCNSDFGTKQYFEFCEDGSSSCSFEDVKYSFKFTQGGITDRISVDWSDVTYNGPKLTQDVLNKTGVTEMLAAYKKSHCTLWPREKMCKNEGDIKSQQEEQQEEYGLTRRSSASTKPSYNYCPSDAPNCPQTSVFQAGEQCVYDAAQYARINAWDFCVANADMYLAQYMTTGTGQDYQWPPSSNGAIPRDWQPVVQQTIEGSFGSGQNNHPGTAEQGKYYSPWMQGYLNKALDKIPNIMWSNGRLDPWAGGGVYPGLNPYGYERTEALANITADGSSQSLLIDFAGHHVDLFFTHPDQPAVYTAARKTESDFIDRVVQDAFDQM